MANIPGSHVELVITAPEPHGKQYVYATRCRTTLGVLVELFLRAKYHVIMAAPFVQPLSELADGVLADVLQGALRRGVKVDVLSTGAGLMAFDRTQLLPRAQGQLRFYRPAANVVYDQRLGSHAKFCVADGESAYVGSANLTSPGLTDQIELGLLVNGDIARQISDVWDYLVGAGVFVLAD
ncbi:MAG: phospholipase D family protein [Thermoflexales bacterium]|nr:phospholipase D family protein [Thermoflexales bacterium]